jgi:DHA1 family tetracycline resistance protein-like MFS transporter
LRLNLFLLMIKSERSPLPTIFLTVLIDMLGVGIIIPVIAPLILDADYKMLSESIPSGTRTIIFGFLIASFPIAQFFGAPILGALSDRYGRKKLLFISLLGTFIGYILFAIAILDKNIYLLFISRSLDGFSGGNVAIVLSSISDYSDEKSKAKNFGLVGAAFGLGFILGPYIGGKLADNTIVSWFNVATPFWFAAGLTLINILFVVLAFPETLKASKKSKVSFLTGIKNIRRAFQLQNIRTILFVVFLFTMGFNFFTQFFQVFLFTKFKFSISEIADIFAYIGLWIVLAQGGLQRMSFFKKYTSLRIVKTAGLLLGLTLPLLLFPSNSIYLLFILPFIAIFQGFSLPNLTSLVSSQASAEEQGEILGINQSVQSIGTAAPPIIASYINSVDINLPIATASILIVLGWIILTLFFKIKKTV